MCEDNGDSDSCGHGFVSELDFEACKRAVEHVEKIVKRSRFVGRNLVDAQNGTKANVRVADWSTGHTRDAHPSNKWTTKITAITQQTPMSDSITQSHAVHTVRRSLCPNTKPPETHNASRTHGRRHPRTTNRLIRSPIPCESHPQHPLNRIAFDNGHAELFVALNAHQSQYCSSAASLSRSHIGAQVPCASGIVSACLCL